MRAFLGAIDNPVLADFLSGFDWNMPERSLDPTDLPCRRHLSRLLQIAPADLAPLVEALSSPALRWGQTYGASDFGAGFLDNYGWMELFGDRGHFANDRIAGGVLVLGPATHYPDHHHLAEEIYLPLAGTAEWRRGEGDFLARPPGAVIHHPSQVSHAMRTGGEPMLAFYLWRGGPLTQKSTIGTARGG